MKTKFILTIFITFIVFFASFSRAGAALRAEPVERSPFDQRDRYQTDLFSGSAEYFYPIKVPKGTNDLTPEISLSYSSAGARDMTQRYGAGWQLSQDYVERDANYSPTNTGDDKFRLHFKGGVYDLVNVGGNSYHTKTESFLNIQKFTGGQNEKSEYWQVITQDGTKYRFGYQSQSELMCNGRDYINKWNLDQTEDAHGNKIFYTYSEISGISYLTKIEYNNDKTRYIDNVYETNPYQKMTYVQGCSVTEVLRLKDIQVRLTTGTRLVRQYDLNYETPNNLTQYLQSIIERSGDGSALPATTFTYKPENKSWGSAKELWLNNASVDVHLAMQSVAMTDVNGDGLTDIVRTFGTTWKVLLNQGNSWSSQYQVWLNNAPEDARLDRASNDVRLMDVTGDSLPDIVMAASADSWRVWRNNGTSWNSNYEQWANLGTRSGDIKLSDNRTALADVTGDGLPDIIRTWWNGQQQWEIFRNTGGGWNTTAEVWSYNGFWHGLDSSDGRLMDANGDGLVDIVHSVYNGNNESSTDTWKVFKNTGSGWNTTPEVWINNAPISAHLESTNSTLADVNGDGLVDIVKSDDLGGADRWKVLLNAGNSWLTTWETWVDPSANMDIDAHNDNVRIVDVTGDGLPDLVKTDYNGGNDTWSVYRNNGNAQDLLASVRTAQGGDD